MNYIKLSFLIIVISYVYYKIYSGILIEGQAPGPNKGDYNKEQDKPVNVDDGCDDTCKKYRDKSCLQYATGDWKYGEVGDGKANKIECMKCVQFSQKDSSARRYMAQIGYEANANKDSYFARRLCDAMAAGCDSALWYANNETDWSSQDCKGVSLTTEHSYTTKTLCTMLQNSILQFFLSFLSGVTCTLKIKALEVEQYIEDIPSKLGEIIKDVIPIPGLGS